MKLEHDADQIESLVTSGKIATLLSSGSFSYPTTEAWISFDRKITERLFESSLRFR